MAPPDEQSTPSAPATTNEEQRARLSAPALGCATACLVAVVSGVLGVCVTALVKGKNGVNEEEFWLVVTLLTPVLWVAWGWVAMTFPPSKAKPFIAAAAALAVPGCVAVLGFADRPSPSSQDLWVLVLDSAITIAAVVVATYVLFSRDSRFGG